MGYRNLDIHKEQSGEWFIIQTLDGGLVPCETRWQPVLGPMKNVEISFSFCQKYINDLDIRKKAFWAREEAKTKAVMDETEKTHKRGKEFAERATVAVMKNPDLVQRIAKNGLKEMDLRYLGMRIPKHELEKPLKGVKVDVSHPSEPPVQAVHERVPDPV